MNAQLSIWLCVAVTLFIFVIECVIVHKLKRAVKEKIEWNNQDVSEK